MLLAGSMSALAQNAATPAAATLSTVTVTEKAEAPEGKDAIRATETTIGKGRQQLRDIPQSVTVVTEKLIDDRNLDTVKEALKNTAGISFLAAEGGEEDIRLRGFALQATGDLFIDGMRDPAIYDRDTFNLDRMEVLRGSASMLFGRGSTGGAVNQVTKVPRLIDENQVDITVGSHAYRRVTGDFNIQTGESAALRINAMSTKADNNGAGSSIDKSGVAASYRWGIGERDEFLASLYHLDNNNGVNYGMPWIRPTSSSTVSETTLLDLDPTTYYGMASDYNDSGATIATLSHTHRFSADSELKTQLRMGNYERDMRASTIRFASATYLDTLSASTVLNRGTQLKVQDMETVQLQTDFSNKFEALGRKHHLLAGMDLTREKKTVYSDTPGLSRTTRSEFYTALGLGKTTTTYGTASDGASIAESQRVFRPTADYTATGYGAYVQDTAEVAPHWKLVGGLRFDHLVGDYNSHSYSYSGTTGDHSYDYFTYAGSTAYRMKVSEVSKRVGVLFQPNELQSYHFSAGTSFNTSGDAYSLSEQNVNTPPEQSINIELGTKLDSADKRFSTRMAIFRATKLHERNNDPDRDVAVLTGKRHVAGFEIDIAGRLTPKWEVFGSYMWLPIAKVDQAVNVATPGEREGDRPALTPVHSGTVWSTYQLTPRLRLGAGLNFRGKQKPTRSEFNVPSFVTADLMAEYQFDFDRLTLKANLTNVTNKLYADQLYPGHYIPGAGRLLMVTASLKF
jgi:catecholate siderophore receptor